MGYLEKFVLTIFCYCSKRVVFFLKTYFVFTFVLFVPLSITIADGIFFLSPTNRIKNDAFAQQYPDIRDTIDEIQSAQMCYGNQIDINPQIPTSADAIKITPSGEWCNACVPRYQSHDIVNNIIRIYAEAEPSGVSCPYILLPWAFDVDIGPLSVSTYTVEVYISRWGMPPALNDSKSFNVVPAPSSAIISTNGGELTYHYSGHTTSLIIPPGALLAPSVFTISYHIPPTNTGQLQGMDHFFDLASTQTTFLTPLTLTVVFSESARGLIIPGTENLYGWENSQWVTDEITLTRRWSNSLSAQITHLALFGVLGNTNRVYLPIMLK